jgi:transcriptional regulator with XRE-family HTH domain
MGTAKEEDVMGDRGVFTRQFAAALQQACTERGLTQKRIGELIAQRQHERRRRGPEREAAIATAKTQWPGRLSAWKKGDRLPPTLDELFLALDVITSQIPREQWEAWWRQARDPAPGEVASTAVILPSLSVDLGAVPARPVDNPVNTAVDDQIESPRRSGAAASSSDQRILTESLAWFLRFFRRNVAGRTIGLRSRIAIVVGSIVVVAALAAVLIPEATTRQNQPAPSAAGAPSITTPLSTASQWDNPPEPLPAPPIWSGVSATCKSSSDNLKISFPSCPHGVFTEHYYVHGTVSDIKAGERVWILLWATRAKLFYLVDESPNRYAADSSGNWCSTVGLALDEPYWFYFYVAVIDKQYSDALAAKKQGDTVTVEDIKPHLRTFVYIPAYSWGKVIPMPSDSICKL